MTWDEGLRNVIAPILLQLEDVPEAAQLRVLDPNRLYVLLDELAHAAAYRPDSLEGTEFRSGRAGAGEETVLMAFLDIERGERRTDLRDRLGEFARTRKHHLIVRAPDGTPVACYATELDGGVLRVPLLRLADHATAGTVGRQLLWLLRKQARTSGAQVVEIGDPYLCVSFERIIGYESYQRVGQNWYSCVVDVLGTAAQVGRPELLLSRRADIALGREQVHYRSGRGSALREPSRVVWYVSQSSTTGSGRFIGTSLLDGIDKGRAETLFATCSHYGVFRLSDIRAAAKDGYAQALRLSDTELFASDVPRHADDRLRKPLGGPQVPLSPTRIANQLFAELYALGQRREDGK
ncbi:hypothetical protein QRX60_29890 [Amycolatopsis mongoliensis]|uniref:Uncharacterized protein n=1 Tax=Amycolatopsis mongoliensis TaxID=715475 RepID=A0A9Y2JIC8_9PSEU|nr:hypothetical protein [Amycolatopsis sp. 4-36]WIX98269.1 hypothetical protein QRX60_29890 [Amycolatopsis sp. 4-36]